VSLLESLFEFGNDAEPFPRIDYPTWTEHPTVRLDRGRNGYAYARKASWIDATHILCVSD
jgi:hypothetical protein